MPPFSWKTRSVNMGKGLVIDNHVILRHYRKQTKTKIQQSVQPLDINVPVLNISLTTQRQSILKRRKPAVILFLRTRIPLLWLGEVGGREKVFKQVRRDNTWWVVLFSCALQKHGALADIVKRKATKKLTRWGEDSGDSKGAQKTTVQNAGETQRHRRYLQVPRGGYPQVPWGTQVTRVLKARGTSWAARQAGQLFGWWWFVATWGTALPGGRWRPLLYPPFTA